MTARDDMKRMNSSMNGMNGMNHDMTSMKVEPHEKKHDGYVAVFLKAPTFSQPSFLASPNPTNGTPQATDEPCMAHVFSKPEMAMEAGIHAMNHGLCPGTKGEVWWWPARQ